MRARLAHATAAAPRSAWPPQSRPQASWPRAWTCSSCARRPFASQQQQQQHMAAGDRKPYYITTPIFYVNAAPHVGHLYTLVLTDILKRWRVLKGETALMCTGTDEHGLKVQRASAKAGIDPQLFCDQGAALFKELAARALVSHDHFVRTTDADHKDAVAYAWFLLHEKGLIYTKKHEGWYSVADEAFYPPSAVQPHLDPPTGRKIMVSVETRSEVEWSSEENYHFRLSHFRGPLLQFYRENPEWITPAHRMKDVVHAVESGLEDLSISRPSERLAWGIRVPQDSSQTIYVWLDALINYVTKAGYPWAPGRDHAGGWPADCHVIGKDIVRFHCIYWPAFLMALGLPLPKRILTHAHWTLGGSKMSKSTGRVVDPFLALDRFGPDVMRCYLAHDGGIQDDGNYDNTQIIKLYNNLLWAQLGNLLSRVTRGKKWSVRGAIQRIGPLPASDWANDQGSEFHSTLLKFPSNVAESLDAHDPRRAIRIIADLIRSSNQYVQVSAPWQKILDYGPGEPGEEVDRIVYLAAEALRMAGILLQPYMPNKAKTMLDQLGVDDARRTFEYCAVGRDLHYGAPTVELGVKYEGALFPPLSSEE